MSKLIDELAPREKARQTMTTAQRDTRRSSRRCADTTASWSRHTRTPTATRSGSLLAMHLGLRQLGKDSVMYLGGAVRRFRPSTAFLALDGLAGSASARTTPSECSSPSTARKRAGSAAIRPCSSGRR